MVEKVPSHIITQNISQRKAELKDLNRKDRLHFKDNEGNEIVRPVVWADASEIIEVVSEKRGLNINSIFVK